MSDIVFIYQRMLPYHRARFRAVSGVFAGKGMNCIAIQVTDYDRSYGTIESLGLSHQASDPTIQTLFPGQDYLDLEPRAVAGAVTAALRTLSPDTVFSPAPAFAEGAGALHFKAQHPCRLILMDDAWSVTDQRGWLNRFIKGTLYRLYDGAFIPAQFHAEYYEKLNIPLTRQMYPVDVIEDYDGRGGPIDSISLLKMPYVLFVGRLVKVKQLGVVLHALSASDLEFVNLVVIGDGPEATKWQEMAVSLDLVGRVFWLGRLSNNITREWMRNAEALLLPSISETWGLVVNEAWSAGLPVIGSYSVGALRANYPKEWDWMMPSSGDISAWRLALRRLLSMPTNERAEMVMKLVDIAQQYSLDLHAEAAVHLAGLALRERPSFIVSWLALAWTGRVAVY